MFSPHGQKYPTDPDQIIHARTMTVQEMFAHGDAGLLVPHRHRQYIWGDGQVSRFVGDICRCVVRLIADRSATHCFGSIILLRDFSSDQSIQRLDPYFTPPTLSTLVDGQQRLATLALVASRVYWRLHELRAITHDDECRTLRDVFDQHMDALLNICSFSLRSGFPWRRPIMIHGRFDSWHEHALSGGVYQSAVSDYLGQFLRTLMTDALKPPVDPSSFLAPHIAMIDRWLNVITTADHSTGESYVTAWTIRSGLSYLDRQLFIHPAIIAAVAGPTGDRDSISYRLQAFVLLWAFAHTLLRRCCFVVITPTTERAMESVLEVRRRELAQEDAG
ncbi:DUF262 domain-containing protein [Chloroflexales bacterium ZM16-3]|nr:DUF262 domain-containing protein [Chloroflexales bacterium ZM16-3]